MLFSFSYGKSSENELFILLRTVQNLVSESFMMSGKNLILAEKSLVYSVLKVINLSRNK